MRMVEKLLSLMRPDRHSVDRMEERSQRVTHDLTNLRARVDVLSRLVGKMREEQAWRNGDAHQ